MRRKVGMREVILALDVKRPKGIALLAHFLREMSEGKIPETETTTKLADAFERIVFENRDPLTALRLKRGRGERTPLSAAQVERRDGPICRFIWAALEREGHKRGALTRAIAAAEAKFAKSTRHIEETWARNKHLYDFMKYCREMGQLWKKYLTAEEWELMKDGPAIDIDRLVLKRHKASLAKSK